MAKQPVRIKLKESASNRVWDVLVDDVGIVYSGEDSEKARKAFTNYEGTKRVTLLLDGKIVMVHTNLFKVDK